MVEASSAVRAPETPGLCSEYRPIAGIYDEMCGQPGRLRAHWQYLVDSFETMGLPELERRRQEARRLIRDNGVTYNVYGDPQGVSRPWELDLVPLLIRSEEWSRIERGLIQRAEVLNLLLADLYGAGSVISKGVLPPELVMSHPGFQRPCVGITMPDQHYLPLYAADLARAPDGKTWVIGDRGQVPSGAGYALENRIVLSRVLPSVFRDSHVHRLALFFRTMRSTLAAMAPRETDSPRVVVMTPGPRNETYFEHAYMANYLGYSLVQGNDLVVREDMVWLRTLDGLQRVDVILRRVDDEYCDPLELREDSFLGVPGLAQAARARRVTVANPLGSGILENPALMAYMPALCRHLLGEDLQIPNVATWWCGTPVEREHVLANLDKLVIKPVRPTQEFKRIFGAELDPPAREKLREAIRAHPYNFVGQEHVSISTAPVLVRRRLEARHTVLRSFLVAREDGYVVMPGGLSRAAPVSGNMVVSNQQGGLGKDTWVIASEPEKQESLIVRAGTPQAAGRRGGEVPSSVVDNLFWIGRYAERAEALVRLLRVIVNHRTEQFGVSGIREEVYCLRQLLRAVTHQSGAYPGFVGEGAEARLSAPDQELLAIIAGSEHPGGLLQVLQSFLQAARSVRDQLSVDTWRVVNDLDEEVEALRYRAPAQLSDALDELDAMVTALTGFTGLTLESMTHSHGWRFLEIGRRLERAMHTAGLLRATLVPVGTDSEEAVLIESVLRTSESLITYRRAYSTGMQVAALLDLLLYDEANPRAVAYQLTLLEEHVAHLPRDQVRSYRTPEERLALRALTELRMTDAEALAVPEDHLRKQLDGLLSRVQSLTPAVSDAITAHYFRHVEMPHQLVRLRPGVGP